ncbi:MAG TPA: acyl-CoA dehydrogenase family protein [Streptosporangiaceae bacterium]
MPVAEGILASARHLADEVLFPDAMRVDRLDALPGSHLDALAAAGLYGAPAPADAGGLGLDLAEVGMVVEELAGGCLATAFVWIQHFRLLMTLAADGAPAALRNRWLAPACRGTLRGGIALTGLMPGPPLLSARPVRGAWRVDGTAPWVTGWGLVDLVVVVARGPGDTVVTLIMDAVDQSGLTASRQRLSAVDASVTVRLGFDGVLVPEERVAGQSSFDPAASTQPEGLRVNGSLALGVTGRCCRLLGPGPLDDELAACRERLDEALDGDAAAMAAARAAACELAIRAAAALAVRDGSRSIMVDQHAQRLAREAVFLLVFGSRPAIKSALLHQFRATPP